MGDNRERTVSDVGEFGVIDDLRSALPIEVIEHDSLLYGIGDDAAVWRPTPGAALVVTTDSLVEGIHFRLDWTDWASLGHKTLAVNLSDLAAMGATPRLAVLTLGLRGDERVSDLRALYNGLGALAARSGTLIAGGDIVRSPTALTLHVTAFGEVVENRVLTRSGARPGDVIGVSGTLGAAAAGLRLLDEGPGSVRRDAATAATLIDAHLRPEPRLALGARLHGWGATAAMDLSDGLLGDLPKILAASDVGARVDGTLIPVASAILSLFPDDWLQLATQGGEDYELLFTAPALAFATIEQEGAALGITITAVGTVISPTAGEPRLALRDADGQERAVADGAFDHFAG
jgi:thiamine-monophosphate kinase